MSARIQKKQSQQLRINQLTKALKLTMEVNQQRARGGNLFDNGRNGIVDRDSSHDTKRDQAWTAYGYPESVDFPEFYSFFNRNPIAKGLIMRMVDKSWETLPEISEHEEAIDAKNKATPFDKELKRFFKRTKFWSRCKGVDWRQRVGRYAGLVIIAKEANIPEGQERQLVMSEPLKLNSLDQIMKFVPVTEEQLEVLEDDVVNDPTDPRFGMPTYYHYQENELGTKSDRARTAFQLHHSRVIIFAEGAETGVSIYGRPVLEACYNNLVDLEKIWGGGAEGFLLNARTPLNINMQAGDNAPDPAQLAQLLGTDLDGLGDAFDEQIQEYIQGVNAHLLTQGMDVKNLSVSIPDPEKYVQVELEACCAGEGLPVPILIGQQIGQRSSDENAKEWARTVESRKKAYLYEAIEFALEHLMDIGAMKRKEIYVHWDSLLNASPTERAELFKLQTEGNKNLMGTLVQSPITTEILAETLDIDISDLDMADVIVDEGEGVE